MATEPSRVEANRLYWETDASVGGIAEQLGISRRALYELLQAAPLEARCPHCGGALSFANRLARSTGEARCAGCGAAVGVKPVHVSELPPPQPFGAAAGAAVNGGAAGARGETDTSAGSPGAAEAGPGPGAAADALAPAGPAPGTRRAPLRPPPLPLYDPEPRLTPADFAFAAAVGIIGGLIVGFLVSRRTRE